MSGMGGLIVMKQKRIHGLNSNQKKNIVNLQKLIRYLLMAYDAKIQGLSKYDIDLVCLYLVPVLEKLRCCISENAHNISGFTSEY